MAPGGKRRMTNNAASTQNSAPVEGAPVQGTADAQPTQSSQGGTMTLKKGRDISKNIALSRLLKSNRSKPLTIDIPEGLLKPVTGPAKEWTAELGIVGRREIPASLASWKHLSEVDKDKLYNLIGNKFEVNDGLKVPIDKQIMGSLRGHRHQMKLHFDRMKRRHGNPRMHPYKRVEQEEWQVICDKFESPEFQRISEINSMNRRKSDVPHVGGSKPFVRHRHDMLVEQDPEHADPHSVNIDLYKKMHYKEGVGWVHPCAEQMHRDMVSLSQGVGSESGPISGNEAFRCILGTKKGYERGLGYGVKPTQSTRSNRAEVEAANKRANEAEERARNAEMMALEALEKVKEMDELRTTMEQHIRAFNDMMAGKSPIDLGTED